MAQAGWQPLAAGVPSAVGAAEERETLIETIRTFSTKQRGQKGDREIIVVTGQVWRCTVCGKVFESHDEAMRHDRREHEVSPTTKGH